jgi:hypothetical protein
MREPFDRLPRYVTVVAGPSSVRARARAELVERFEHVFACAPERLEELMRTIKCDVIVFVGPEADAVRASVMSAVPIAGRRVVVVDDASAATPACVEIARTL